MLLEAVWQPAGPGEFEDRPASPRKGSAAAGPASAAPIRSAGYVPPHQRTSAGTSQAMQSALIDQAPELLLTYCLHGVE